LKRTLRRCCTLQRNHSAKSTVQIFTEVTEGIAIAEALGKGLV
jgi:hypothetical protein